MQHELSKADGAKETGGFGDPRNVRAEIRNVTRMLLRNRLYGKMQEIMIIEKLLDVELEKENGKEEGN